MTYYQNIPDGRLPDFGCRFTVRWERPTDYQADDRIVARPRQRGRTLLIFEGESPFIDRVLAKAQSEIEAIRAEVRET
jgi:hypothetical protein